MDIVTIVGLLAATITVSTTLYVVFKRVKRVLHALDERLVAIEDNFKVREELIVKHDIIVKNEDNSKIYTLKHGTVVIVYNINNDIVEFITRDRLIKSYSNIRNFVKEEEL